MTALCSKTRDTEEKNFKPSKAFLFRKLFSSLWIRIKMLKTFCKRVIGKFRFQKKEWLMMKGETTALCSKTRVTFANNSNLQKQEQNSQYFEIKLDTQDFLYNIRQSLVYCHGKKLISTRLELHCSFHAYRSYYWRRGQLLVRVSFSSFPCICTYQVEKKNSDWPQSSS